MAFEIWLIVLLIVMFVVVTYFCIRTFESSKYAIDADLREHFDPLSSPFDVVVSAFKLSRGRLPTKSEAQELVTKLQTGMLNVGALQSYIDAHFTSGAILETGIENLFNSFGSVVDQAIANPTTSSRVSVAQAYNRLFCLALSGQSLKEFMILMEARLRERMMFVMSCVNEFRAVTTPCEDVNAVDSAMFNDASSLCAAVDNSTCGNGRDVNIALAAGKDRAAFDKLVAAADKVCKDKLKKCTVLRKKEAVTVTDDDRVVGEVLTKLLKGDAKTVNFVISRPNIYYRDGRDGGAPSVEVEDGPIERAENEVTKRCMLDLRGKNTQLADLTKGRNSDELGWACDRSKSTYINADDSGKLLPDQRWSVPQKRPPVCTPMHKATVNNTMDQSSLIGTLLSDANDTKVGSILPTFRYSGANPK
jgi:hypothetical protein